MNNLTQPFEKGPAGGGRGRSSDDTGSLFILPKVVGDAKFIPGGEKLTP